MQVQLNGRSALITGGSKGLGLATAICMAQSGANVAIAARNPDDLGAARERLAKAAPDARVLTLECDVTSPEQIKATYEQACAEFKAIDIVVNNAGHQSSGAFVDVSDEMWDADLQLKLMATVRLTRLAWPGMVERKWGRVINVLNTFSKTPMGGTAPTSVTRAAQLALTKVLAQEGAPHNILVNALLVGLIKSDQIVRRHKAAGTDQSLEEFMTATATRSRVPMGRFGEAEEFANMACFLASDAASYITGTAINVDGGMLPTI